MKRLEVFLLPLDGMLVHHRLLPRNLLGFPPTIRRYPFTHKERDAVRVKCLAPKKEQNTMSPARARTRTATPGVERSHHEATMPPTKT